MCGAKRNGREVRWMTPFFFLFFFSKSSKLCFLLCAQCAFFPLFDFAEKLHYSWFDLACFLVFLFYFLIYIYIYICFGSYCMPIRVCVFYFYFWYSTYFRIAKKRINLKGRWKWGSSEIGEQRSLYSCFPSLSTDAHSPFLLCFQQSLSSVLPCVAFFFFHVKRGKKKGQNARGGPIWEKFFFTSTTRFICLPVTYIEAYFVLVLCLYLFDMW